MSPESNSSNRKYILLFPVPEIGKKKQVQLSIETTMLAKLEALMDSYVKNFEAEMFFRVFSGNELRD